MPFKTAPLLCCSTLILLNSTLTLAEDITATETLLETIPITTTAAEQALPTTTETDAETLDKRFIRSFEDLGESGEPGVSFNSKNESINIRGLDGDRVLTTIDGIRVPWLNDAVRGVSGGLDAIDFNSLSSIDVIRGANSSQAGSGALGGALAMRTLDPEDLLQEGKGFASLVKSDYDSADQSWGLNAALAGREQNTLWLLQIGQRQGHEEQTGGNDNLPGTARTEANPADNDQQSVLLKLQQYLSENHRLGLTAEWFEREEDIDSRTNQGTANYPSHYDAKQTNERKRLSLEHRYNAAEATGFIDWAQSTLYWQDMRREDQVKATRAGTLAGPYGRNNHIEKEQYGLFSSVGKRLGMHELTLGGEWSRVITEQYSAGYDACPDPLLAPPSTSYGVYYSCLNLHTNQAEMPKTSGSSYAVHIKDAITLREGLTLTPGLRYDAYQYKPSRSTTNYVLTDNSVMFNENEDSKVSGSLLLSWQASAQAMFYAQWAQGFKAPDANELYTTFVNSGMGYAVIGNPNLKPEESTGYEVGTRLGNDALGASLSLFYNKYKNFIDSVSADPSEYGFSANEFAYGFNAMENRDKVRIYGAEASAHWQLAPSWKVWSNIAWAVGKDQDSDRHLNSVAPLKGNFGLTYEQDHYGAELIFTAARKRDKVEEVNDFKTPGYGVTNLTAYWQPAALDGVKLQAGIFNLLDKKYWDAVSIDSITQPADYYSEAGRNLRLSASWQY